jgi:PEP-CTERM motif
MRFRRIVTLIVAATFLLVFVSPTEAVPFFFAEVTEYTYGGGLAITGSIPVDTGGVSGTGSNTLPGSYFTGRAAVDAGIVRSGIHYELSANGQTVSRLFFSTAQFLFDDLYITGPAGPESITATMNVRVDGEMLAEGESYAGIARLNLRLGSNDVDSSYLYSSTISGGNGLLAGQSGPSIHDTVSFTSTLSTTQPNHFGVLLTTDAAAGAYSGGYATSDFFDTVHLVSGGPVFDLPAGYTANSVSANIVDNQWMGVVPEPSSCLLGLIAAAGMAAVAIRRKSCRAATNGAVSFRKTLKHSERF